jgi:tetratricopeptide (TPR) repeat protein
MKGRDEQLETVLRSVIYLSDIAQIRAVLSELPVSAEEIDRGFERIDRELESAGSGPERSLLAFVRQAVLPAPPSRDAEAPRDLNEPASLLAAARQCPTMLRAWRLFRSYPAAARAIDLGELLAGLARNRGGTGEEMRVVCALSAAEGDRASRARTRMIWSSWHRRAGRLESALRHAEIAARLAAESGDVPLQIMLLGTQALTQKDLGDPKATQTLMRSLELAENSGQRELAAPIRYQIAGDLRDAGDYGRAIDLLGPAVEAYSSTRASPQLARALNLRALAYDDLGRHDRAIADFEAALAAARAAGDMMLRFEVETNLAASFAKRGRPEAIERFAGVVRSAKGYGDPVLEASARNNLAQVLLQFKRPSQALEQFQKAMVHKVNGDPQGELITFIGMSNALEALGDKDAAETFHALALVPAVESGDPGLLSMWSSHAIGDPKIEDLEADLERLRHSGPAIMERLAARRVAEAYLKLEDPARALSIVDPYLPDEHIEWLGPDLLPLAVVRARALAATDQRAGAIEILSTLTKRADEEADQGPMRAYRSEVITRASGAFDTLIELCGAEPEPRKAATANLAFETHESAKSRSFLSALADGRLTPPPGLPWSLLQKEGSLLAAEGDLETSDQVQSEVDREQRLGRLREQLRNCWAEMEPLAPHYVRLRSDRPAEFEEMRRILDDLPVETAFVSFYCGPSTTTAFVVRRNSRAPSIVSCPVGRAELETLVLGLRRVFNGAPHEFPPYPPIRGRFPEQRSLAAFQEGCAPLLGFLPEIEGAELVCITGHGPLHLLPLHALRTPDGKYMIEQVGVAYCPSLSAAQRIIGREAARTDEGSRAMVVGIASRDDARPERFEAEEQLFDPAYWRISAALGADRASKRHVLEAAHDHEVIHFSCHGHFDAAEPLGSGLLLSDGRNRPPSSSLSFLERASFLLTARELRYAKLQADLVTLSACSTGLQNASGDGDEFEGLPRALLLAGASSILATLWNVDQESSAEFFRIFYGDWGPRKAGVAKWEALRRAQLSFLNSDNEWLRHPYHWAPYELIGDWR